MELHLQLGTHAIRLYPHGESWRVWTQWHEPVFIHNWTLGKLQDWADAAENDNNYVMAEAKFIWLATGERGVLLKS